MKIRKILFPLLTSIVLSSCSQNNILVAKSYFSFATIFGINIYQNAEEKTFRKIESLLNEYNKLFDSFNEYQGINNVYKINQTNDEIQIDKKLFDALKLADKYYHSSLNDYFNPYLGEFTFYYKDMYETYNKDNSDNKVLNLPSKEYIQTSLNNLNKFELKFNDASYSVKRNGNSLIDLGAFAKGYVLNELKNFMKEEEIQYYLINGGTSSVYLSKNPNNSKNDNKFLVGIRYLDKKGVLVKDTSVGISSIFEQLIEFNNQKYSHIINPLTGLSECNYDFSLVIHDDPVLSDILSTSLMLIKDQNELNKIKEEYNFSYMLFKDKKVIYSSNDFSLVDY